MVSIETELVTRDGVALHACVQRPPREVRAAIAMLHGLGEHSGRYRSLHRALTGAGVLVATADLRGFGRSPGARGHIGCWDDYLADTDAILSLARREAPGAPLLLFGHSMGAVIALDHACRHPGGLAGVIAGSPALRAAGRSNTLSVLSARVLSRLMPRLGVEFDLDAAGLSTDLRVVADYLADPLVHGRVTMRWRTEMAAAMKRVRSQAARLELPLLLLHGADDPICDPAGTRRFHDRVASEDKTLRIYAGSRHEVHNDVDGRDFERDIVGWIGERIAPATPQPDTIPVHVVDRAFDPQPAPILRGRVASS